MTNTTENTNLAKVIYRNTVDGKVEVLRFENVMKLSDLRKKFGDEVHRLYVDEPNYFYNDSGHAVLVYTKIITSGVYDSSAMQYKRVATKKMDIFRKMVYTKEDFEEKIRLMKQAGKRLGEIRKQVAEEKYTKEHVITI